MFQLAVTGMFSVATDGTAHPVQTSISGSTNDDFRPGNQSIGVIEISGTPQPQYETVVIEPQDYDIDVEDADDDDVSEASPPSISDRRSAQSSSLAARANTVAPPKTLNAAASQSSKMRQALDAIKKGSISIYGASVMYGISRYQLKRALGKLPDAKTSKTPTSAAIKSPSSGKRFSYTVEQLRKAMNEAKLGKMTIIQASRTYGVPLSTLSRTIRRGYIRKELANAINTHHRKSAKEGKREKMDIKQSPSKLSSTDVDWFLNRNYTKQQYDDAIAAVLNGAITIREASRMYNVPKGTISNAVISRRRKSSDPETPRRSSLESTSGRSTPGSSVSGSTKQEPKAYSPAQYKEAVAKVRSGDMTYREAMNKYNVPFTTLHTAVSKSLKSTPSPRSSQSSRSKTTPVFYKKNHNLVGSLRIETEFGPVFSNPRTQGYTPEDYTHAIRAVRNEGMDVMEAASLYGIPFGTLKGRIAKLENKEGPVATPVKQHTKGADKDYTPAKQVKVSDKDYMSGSKKTDTEFGPIFTGPNQAYTAEDYENAIREVRNEGKDVKETAIKYNIPYGTLRTRIKRLEAGTVPIAAKHSKRTSREPEAKNKPKVPEEFWRRSLATMARKSDYSDDELERFRKAVEQVYYGHWSINLACRKIPYIPRHRIVETLRKIKLAAGDKAYGSKKAISTKINSKNRSTSLFSRTNRYKSSVKTAVQSVNKFNKFEYNRKHRKYPIKNLFFAVEAVRSNKMDAHQAATKYRVPRGTILYRLGITKVGQNRSRRESESKQTSSTSPRTPVKTSDMNSALLKTLSPVVRLEKRVLSTDGSEKEGDKSSREAAAAKSLFSGDFTNVRPGSVPSKGENKSGKYLVNEEIPPEIVEEAIRKVVDEGKSTKKVSKKCGIPITRLRYHIHWYREMKKEQAAALKGSANGPAASTTPAKSSKTGSASDKGSKIDEYSVRLDKAADRVIRHRIRMAFAAEAFSVPEDALRKRVQEMRAEISGKAKLPSSATKSSTSAAASTSSERTEAASTSSDDDAWTDTEPETTPSKADAGEPEVVPQMKLNAALRDMEKQQLSLHQAAEKYGLSAADIMEAVDKIT